MFSKSVVMFGISHVKLSCAFGYYCNINLLCSTMFSKSIKGFLLKPLSLFILFLFINLLLSKELIDWWQRNELTLDLHRLLSSMLTSSISYHHAFLYIYDCLLREE